MAKLLARARELDIDGRATMNKAELVDARWFTRSELASVGVDVGLRRMADKAVARRLLTP